MLRLLFTVLVACGGESPEKAKTTDEKSEAKAPEAVATKEASQEAPAGKEGGENPEMPKDIENALTLSGKVSYDGKEEGKLVLEVLQNAESSGQPVLIQKKELAELGVFDIPFPKGAANLNLMAYIDVNGDQVSEGDPRGYYEIASSTENISGVELKIYDPKDLKKAKGK